MVRENTYWFENLFLVKSTKLFAWLLLGLSKEVLHKVCYITKECSSVPKLLSYKTENIIERVTLFWYIYKKLG
jgi:hypothetical protein